MVGRVGRLLAGCVALGVGIALMVGAALGLSPWDVLHQGISKRTGIPIGTSGILVGLAVLAMWVPLRHRPGWGTAVNVVLVGLTVDLTLAVLPDLDGLGVRAAALAAGDVLCAAGTALYITARLGTGPRDGLMTALSERHGRSIRLVRTGLELSALALGIVLGGQAGVGTVVFALTIGPLIQLFLGRFRAAPIPLLTTPAE